MDGRGLVHFAAGAIGGIAGTTFTCPIDVLKTRLQSSEHVRGGSVRLLGQIVREEGLGALWKGYLPLLVGVVPKRAFYLYTYSTSKRLLNESNIFSPNTSIVHMLSAGVGCFVTTTMLTPMWMIKTRLQLHHGALKVKDVVRKIYNQGGMRGFYRVNLCIYAFMLKLIEILGNASRLLRNL
jgi:solute carrier family 25 protein 33/36